MHRRLALLIMVALGGCGSAASSADVIPALPPLQSLYDAFVGGHYALLGALSLVVLVAAVKKAAGNTCPWVHSDAGGAGLALLAAVGAAAATSLAVPGATLSFSVLTSALCVGFTAAGGYAVLKKLLVDPLLRPLALRAPLWLQPVFQLVFWIFDKPSPIPVAVALGAEAVRTAPALGLNGVVGAPRVVK